MDRSAPRSTPLTLVSGALAGDDLPRIAATATEALGTPVAIAVPALGDPVVAASAPLDDEQRAALAALAAGHAAGAPPALSAETVPVRIGARIVGTALSVPATITPEVGRAAGVSPAERRAWLDAAAAAAAVAALVRGAVEPPPADARDALLWDVLAGSADELPGLLGRARRLGVELSAGASAICAQPDPAAGLFAAAAFAAEHGLLLAEAPDGRLLGLAPGGDDTAGEAIADRLRERGMTVAVSAPRRDPAALSEAIREAELLLELATVPAVQLTGPDETYRLLIGVLLRDRSELEQLRATTISPLVAYDETHETELLATLQAFLTHDGSTTETAEAMALHRHTVGYRLARLQEVSGLSPYASDGRERLGLGLKAHQILAAAERRAVAPAV